MKEPESTSDILDGLEELAQGQERVSIADVLEGFGDRSYGPFLLIPALLEITPVGAIPGVPTFLAVTIAIVAIQMLIGNDHLWLPGFIENRSVSSGKLCKAVKKLRKIADFLDRHFHGRWKRFTGDPARRIAAVVILILCASIPPLEFLPFASSGPMLAIAAFGVAILVRDGVLMLGALALSLGALGLGMEWYSSSGEEGGGG